MTFGSNDMPPQGTAPGIDFAGLSAGQNFDDDEGGGIDFRRYLSAIVRHKWLIIGLTVVGTVAGVIGSTYVTPYYTARAAVQLPPSGRQWQQSPTGSAPLVEGLGWVELVRSYQVLDGVVRARRSYLVPALPADSVHFTNFELGEKYAPDQYTLELLADGNLRLTNASGTATDVAAVGDSLGRPFGFRWVPTGTVTARDVVFRITSVRDASVALDGNLETNISRDGSTLRLTLWGVEPNETAEVLNTLVARFIQVATTLKNDKLTTVTRVLGEQLASARVDLQNAEVELQRFKVETITLPSDGAVANTAGLTETNPARQAFFQLRVDRDLLERDRTSIARALGGAGDSSRSLAVSLGSISSVRASTELSASLTVLTEKRARLQQLLVAFAPGHPQVRALETEIATLERQTIPAQARSLMADLQQQIGDVDGRIGASSREMQQIPVRFTEEARRQRNVQVAQMIYTQLQSSYENARLAEMSAAPDLRLLDAAVPPNTPESNQVTQILLLGFAGGLLLGLALAILLDRFDSRIRYPEQVSRDLGLHILGALPMLGKGPDGAPNRDDVAALLEATRAIRMSLVYAHGTAGPFVTTITSPGAGDGKSFTAANIAKAFASSGRKTILIDADNRRGVLHRAFGVERKPGLMELLSGSATLDEVVHSLSDSGIDFLPTGTRMAAAPEMLSSQKMQQLLAELRVRYQAIIFDSPPLGAGVDPLVLASMTGSLVLVLRNGVTDRAFAGARLDALQKLPIRILGAILNDVSTTEGMYKYYSYLPGYRSEDEVESEEQLHRRIASGTKQ
jgi:capsular exopolysaccharide synthesis family protein